MFCSCQSADHTTEILAGEISTILKATIRGGEIFDIWMDGNKFI